MIKMATSFLIACLYGSNALFWSCTHIWQLSAGRQTTRHYAQSTQVKAFVSNLFRVLDWPLSFFSNGSSLDLSLFSSSAFLNSCLLESTVGTVSPDSRRWAGTSVCLWSCKVSSVLPCSLFFTLSSEAVRPLLVSPGLQVSSRVWGITMGESGSWGLDLGSQTVTCSLYLPASA